MPHNRILPQAEWLGAGKSRPLTYGSQRLPRSLNPQRIAIRQPIGEKTRDHWNACNHL